MSPQLDQTVNKTDYFQILIVDDTLENVQLLARMLTNQGYSVRKTTSGKMALQFVERQPPDLIFLDINMPDLNGYQVCKQLKESANTCDIPVIFISALDRLGYKIQAFEVGGADYITKPFQEQEVLMRVRNQLLIQQQKRQLIEQNQHLQIEISKRQQAEQTLQTQMGRERLLASVIQHVRQSLDLEQILLTTVTEAREILQSDRALIYKADPDSAGTIVSECDAPNVENLQKYTLPEDIFPRSHHEVYRQGRIRSVVDIEQDEMSACLIDTLKWLRVKSKLVVPIVTSTLNESNNEDELWGLLVFHQCFAPREWSQSEIELIQQLANQVAIAIQQSHLYQQLQTANQSLEQMTITDPLTHIVNRRGFDQYLQKEWQRMLREQSPISLILCDIDYFKNYNDTYGHPAGDLCLFQVAGAMRCQVKRPTDMVARYGGEEFVIVLPNTDSEGASQIVEDIRQELMALSIPHQKSLVADYVTLSFGIATIVPQSGQSPQILVNKADQALYQAKENGRNCLWISN
ncbi:MAG: diguanylate cyclase [Cyanobacteria bacterium]|nr:diguanylate cyclase [Cyanobacteriota bacterium]